MAVRTTMPTRLICGDSIQLSLDDLGQAYPASDGWQVSLALSPLAGGVPVVVNATGGSGSPWLVTLTSTASAALNPGQFGWAIRAIKDGIRDTPLLGKIVVLADPAATNADQRSQAQRVLDAIDAVIENRASATDLKVTFADGRSIERLSHSELLAMRKDYAARVARENASSRGPVRILARL